MIREGLRDVPAMKGLLDGVADAELVELARILGLQPAPGAPAAIDRARAKRGADDRRRGLVRQLPSAGLPRARAGAAPGRPARGLSAVLDAPVPHRRHAGSRHDDERGAPWPRRCRSGGSRALLRDAASPQEAVGQARPPPS